MRSVEQLVEVGERAKDRRDVDIIGHIVAEVGHGRRKDRRQPDRVHAQPMEVVEPADDALEVARAIAVAVHKAARIDLVHDPGLPPQMLCHEACSILYVLSRVLVRLLLPDHTQLGLLEQMAQLPCQAGNRHSCGWWRVPLCCNATVA